MARFNQGIMGPFSGKLGTAVGASWKGINYMRALPRRRTKKRQEGEALNQNKFATVHYWLQPLLMFLRQGFKGYSPTVEGFNAAKSYNLLNAFVEKEGRYEIDPARILVSYGDLPLPENLRCELVGHELQVLWDTKPGWQYNRDQVMVLAYDNKNRNYAYNRMGEFRKAGRDILELRRPGEYHVYVAFVADDRSRQSNSRYLGTVTVREASSSKLQATSKDS
jgi:hypothetical protein